MYSHITTLDKLAIPFDLLLLTVILQQFRFGNFTKDLIN